MPAFKDITGLRSGRLVALKPYDRAHNGGYRWLCQCDCGKTTIVRADELKFGHTKSCGCSQEERWQSDIGGRRFGRLVAIRVFDQVFGTHRWLCQCDCGGQATPTIGALRSSRTQSCGCLRREPRIDNFIHGLNCSDPTYASWHDMHTRCTNPKSNSFKNYGERGIKICERWNNFMNFLADMGSRPERKVLDRIDNDGNYEPSNCRWATYVESARNTRKSIPAKLRQEIIARCDAGETPVAIARQYGIHTRTIWRWRTGRVGRDRRIER